MRVSSLCIVAVLILLSGCASTPRKERDSSHLLGEICSVGAEIRSLTGNLWLKADSTDASGQFPADVVVSRDGNLKMEVTNLIGGPEATILVQGKSYSITTVKGKKQEQKGVATWAGIPLQWAATLLIGSVPCPTVDERARATLMMPEEGLLRVEVPARLGSEAQIFEYRWRERAGRPWAYGLDWSKQDPLGTRVTFGFEDPEDGSRVPRRWSAVSRSGSVKVRWKSRVPRG